MKISLKEKAVLKFLLQEAEAGTVLPSTNRIAEELGWPKEETKNRCHRLRAHGLIEPKHETILCSITPAGREQIKSWWRRHIVLIVTLATLIVAALGAVFTILLYLRGCEDKITGIR